MKLAILILISFACVRYMSARAMLPAEVYTRGADAKVVIKVVDQDGRGVPGARIWGGFTCGEGMNDYVLVDGVSDTNGIYVAEGKCNEFLRFDVMKNGYYRTEERIFWSQSKTDPIVVDGKWQPYGEMRKVVLKEIKNCGSLSVPDMRQRTAVELKIPKFDCWIPFDLENFDWNAPYGTGRHPDVLLRFRNRTTKYYYDFTDCIDICFTNNPFAGAYVMKKDRFSDHKTTYETDTNAMFRSVFTFTNERTSTRSRKEDYLKDDAYLVFRTRTTLDSEGKLRSAHYGTILGAWIPGRKSMRFSDGCFNPKENSVIIEDSYFLRRAVEGYKARKR